LADVVAKKSQAKTQSSGKRPYGVGLLLIGVGNDGPRLFETCPSGQHWEYNAQAIGRRAQAGKTYLEQHFNEFPNASRDELIRHVLKALSDCRSKDETTSIGSMILGVVGIGEQFTILEGEALRPYIE
jgi:20S proteasome subunit alpha 6